LKKVLFITHQTGFIVEGGAEIQLERTYKNINELNGDFVIKKFDMWNDKIKDYDIVHLFNPRGFPCESVRVGELCNFYDVKMIVSPIFYRNEHCVSDSLMEKVKWAGEELISELRKNKLIKKYFPFIDIFNNFQKILDLSDFILPNTTDELNLLSNLFGIDKNKFKMVPNGVDIEFKNGNPNLFKDTYGLNDYFLFTGRIEPRKNIIRLIEAFKKSNIETKLVIIGKAFDTNYINKCKKIANNNVLFINNFPHESEMLKSAYAGANTFILPSYFETPGISALEAGLAGTKVIITKYGGTKDYFSDLAEYVDPVDIKSITNAMIDEYFKPKTYSLSNHIERNFSWKSVADVMVKVYDSIL
jgi:glycosyltransferase involved in cell wall biosynthesis